MIKSLQSLRFFAISAVFLSHLHVIENAYPDFFRDYFSHGYFGVTFFLVLSGFVMCLKYFDAYQDASLKSSFSFLKKRLSKIYPLHLISLAAVIPLTLGIFSTSPVQSFITLILNIFLLQSFVPLSDVYFSFNAVSWFLSTCVLLYFSTPLLLRFLHKIDSKTKMATLLSAIVILEFILILAGRKNENSHWLFYISPPFRLGDYLIGMICGLFVRNRLGKEEGKGASPSHTLLEIAAIAFFMISYLFSPKVSMVLTYGLYFLPSTALIIVVFASQKGLVSRLLGNRVLVYLGGISFEFYMIHQIVINYLSGWLADRSPIVISITSYILSIALAMALNTAISRIMARLKKPTMTPTGGALT